MGMWSWASGPSPPRRAAAGQHVPPIMPVLPVPPVGDCASHHPPEELVFQGCVLLCSAHITASSA